MERRNPRSQSCQRESDKKGEQKSLLASFRDAVIDAVTPSWISMRSPTPGTSRDAADTSDTLSSSSRRLSMSQPNLYENGQSRTIDFSPTVTSQGIPVQSGSRDFMLQGPSRGSPGHESMQPGGSQSFLGQGYSQPGMSSSPDFTQPQSGSSLGTPVYQGFSQLSVPADSRNSGCSQTGTPLGLGRTPKRQDYAQPGPSSGTPFPPPAAVPPVSEFTSSQLPLNRLVDKSDSVMAQDDTVSQRSHSSHSTSGCSSMAPQNSHGNRVPSQDPAKRRRESGEFTVGTQTPPPQPQAKRPRLNVNISNVTHNHNTSYTGNVTWTELHRQRMDDTPIRDRQPHFKPHLLGSPLGPTTGSDESPFSRRARSEDSRRNSDYYPGPTTYMGRYNYRDQESQQMIDSLPRPGAIRSRSEQRGSQRGSSSADRRQSQWPYPTKYIPRPEVKRLHSEDRGPLLSNSVQKIFDAWDRASSPVNWPYPVKVIPRPRVKPLHPEQQGEPVISETARKIMEVLDGMKTPLSDAKKIPVIVPDYWPTTRFSQERPRNSGPPTRGMQVGGLADVVPNRQVYGRNPQPGPSGSPQPGPSGVQSNRARQAAGNQASNNQAEDANNQALQVPSAAQVRQGFGSRESQDDERHAGEDRQVIRARRRLPEPTTLRTAPTISLGNNPGPPFALPAVDFNLTSSPSGHHFQCTFSPNSERRQPANQPSPAALGAFQFSQPIDVEEVASQQGTNRDTGTTPQPTTSGFSFSSPIKQGSPGVVSDTNTSKALTQGSICSTGTNFTDKSASLKDMLNSSPGVGGGGFSFKPADSLKNSILDKFDNSGSKFSKPYQKPNRNSATNKLVNSDAGFGGFRPTEKLKQGSVMDVLGGSGFKPAEKLKSGSVMDVLGKDSNAGFSFKPADPLKKGSVMDILGNSGSGFKPASELKQGSVMDILGGSATTSTTDLPGAKSAATSTTGLAPVAEKTTGTSNTSLGAQSDTEKTASLASLFKTASGTWECGVCLIQNKPEAAQCLACQTPKPGGKGPEKSDSKHSATDSSKSSSSSSSFSGSEPASKSSSQDLSAMFKPPTGTWSCLVCMIQNKPDMTQCAACQTPKPEKKSATKPLPTGTPSGWTCDVCLVPNKGSDNVCVACQSEKPVKRFEHPPGDWDCETCNFTNKEGAIRCCNCEYIRPGPPRTQCVPSVVKTFLDARNKERFGESTSVSNSAVSKFGTVSSVAAGTVTSSGFKMGGSSGPSSTSGFKFGDAVTNSESKPLGTGFQFGNSSSTSKPQSLGTGFKFGAPAGSEKTTTTSVTGFGTSSASLTSVSTGSGFQFGGTLASKQTESAVKTNSASNDTQSKGFQSSATSTSGFAFGSPLVTASAKVTSSQTTASLTSSIQSSATSAPLSFKFGSVASKDVKLTNSSAPTTVSQTGFPVSSIGGFNFSANKTNTVTVNSVQSTVCSTAPTGGFAFSIKPSIGMSGPSSTPADKAVPAQPTPAPAGGFNFATAQSAPAAQSAFGGFNAAQKPAEPTAQKPKPAENATPGFGTGGFSFNPGSTETGKQPAFGGFNSAPKPGENATPAFGGFNFKPAQTEAPKIAGFGISAAQGQSTSFGQPSSVKRSVEDDSSAETSAKKAPVFNFGAASSTNTSFQMPGSSNDYLDSNSHGQHNKETSKRVTWKKILVKVPSITIVPKSPEQSASTSSTEASSENCGKEPSSSLAPKDSSPTSSRSSTPTGSSRSSSRSSTPTRSSRTPSRSPSPTGSSRSSSRDTGQAEATDSPPDLTRTEIAPITSTETSGKSATATETPSGISTQTATTDSTELSSRSSAQVKATESPSVLARTEAAPTSSTGISIGNTVQVEASESQPALARVVTAARTGSALTGATQTSSTTRNYQMSLGNSVPTSSTQTSQKISAQDTPANSPSVSAGTDSVFVFGRQNQCAGKAESIPSTSARSGPITLQNLGDLMKLGTQVSSKGSKQTPPNIGAGQPSSGLSVTEDTIPAALQNVEELTRFETHDSPQRQLTGSDSGGGRSTPESQPSAMEAEQSSQHADLSGFSFGTGSLPTFQQPVMNASQPMPQQQIPQASTQNLMPSLGDLMKYGALGIMKTPTVSKPTSVSSQSGSQASPRVFVFGGSGQTVEKAKQRNSESPTPSNTALNNGSNLVSQHAAISSFGTESIAEMDVSPVSQPTPISQSGCQASSGVFVFGRSGQTAEKARQNENIPTFQQPAMNVSQPIPQQAPIQSLMPSLEDLMKFGAQSIPKTPPATQPVSTHAVSQPSSGVFVFGGKGQTVDKDKQEKANQSETKSPPPSNKAVNFFPNLGELMSTSQSGSRAPDTSNYQSATQNSHQSTSLFVFGSTQNKTTTPATSSGSPATQSSQQSASLFVFGSTSKPAEDTGKDASKVPPQSMKANPMNLGDLMKFGAPDTQMSTSTGFPSPVAFSPGGSQKSRGLAFSMDNAVSMTTGQSMSSQGFRLAYAGFFPEAMDADFEKSNSSFGSMHASFYDEADLKDYFYMSDSSQSSSSSSVSRKSSRSHHRSRRHKKSSRRSSRSSRHSSASSRSGSRSRSKSASQLTKWWSKSRRRSKSSLNSRSSSSRDSRNSSVSSRNSSRSSSRGRSTSRGRSKSRGRSTSRGRSISRGRSRSRRRSRSGSSRSSRRSSQSSRGRSKTPGARKASRSPSCHRSGSATSETSRSKANHSTKDDKTALNVNNSPGSSRTMESDNDKNDNEGSSTVMNIYSRKKPLTASVFGGTKDFAQDSQADPTHLSRAGTGSFGCFDPLSRTRKDTETMRPNILTPSAFGRANSTDTIGPSTPAKLTNSSGTETIQQSTPASNLIVFGRQDAHSASSSGPGKVTETLATPKRGTHSLMPSLGELMKGGLQCGSKKEPSGTSGIGTVNIPASETKTTPSTSVQPPSLFSFLGESGLQKEPAAANDAGTVNISASETTSANIARHANLIPSLRDLMNNGLQGGPQKEPPGPSDVGTVNIPASQTTALIQPTTHQDLVPSPGEITSRLQNTTQHTETGSASTTESPVTSVARPHSLMPCLGDLMKGGLLGIKQLDKPGILDKSGSQTPTLSGISQGPTLSTSGAAENASSALQTTAINVTLEVSTQSTSGATVNTGTVNISASQTPIVNTASQCTTEPPTAGLLNAGTANIPASATQPSLNIAAQNIPLSTPLMMNSGINIPQAPTPPTVDIGHCRILQAPTAPLPLQVRNVAPNIAPAIPVGQNRILQAPPPPLQVRNVAPNIPPATYTGLHTEVRNASQNLASTLNFGLAIPPENLPPDLGFAVPQIPLQPVMNTVPARPTLPVVNGQNSILDGMNFTPTTQFFANQNDMQAAPALPLSSYAPTSGKSRMECGSPSPSASRMSCISQLSPRKMAMSPLPSPQPALMVMSDNRLQSPQVSPRKMAISPQFSPGKMTVSPQPGLSNMETQNIPVVISPVNRGLPLFPPQNSNIGLQNVTFSRQHYANRTVIPLQYVQTTEVIPLPAPPMRLPAPPPSNMAATPLPPPQQANAFNAGLCHSQLQTPGVNCLRTQPSCVNFGAQSSYCGSVETGMSGASVPVASTSGSLPTSSTFAVTADRNIAACGQNFAQNQVQPSHESALKSPGAHRKTAGVRFNPSATRVEYPACEYSQHDHTHPMALSQNSGHSSGYTSGYTSESSMADVLAEIAAEPEEEAINPNGHFSRFFQKEMERKKRERDRGKRGMKGPKKTKRKRSPPPAGLPSPPRSRSPSPETFRSTSPTAVSKRMCMKSEATTRLHGPEPQSNSRTAQNPESISDGSQNSSDVPKSVVKFKTEEPTTLDSVRSSNKSPPPDKSRALIPEPCTSTGGSTGRSGTKRRPWFSNSKDTVVVPKPSVIRISRRISFQDEITPPRPPTPPEVKKRVADKEDKRADSSEPPEKRPSLTVISQETKKPIIKLSQPKKKKSPPPRPPPPRPPTPEAEKRKAASDETSDTATQPPRKIPEPDASTLQEMKSKTPSPPLVKKKSPVHAYRDKKREEKEKKEKSKKTNKEESSSASPSSSGSSHGSEASESVSVLQAWARLKIASASSINVPSASSTSAASTSAASAASKSATAANPLSASNSASPTASDSSSSAAASNTNQNANAGGFAFGAQATSTPAAPFAFGAQQPAQAPTPAAPAPAVPQSFNFSATPNLNFTASAAPAPGGFAFSAAPSSSDSSKRVVKKAVRRLKR